jgi:hypothetical protein
VIHARKLLKHHYHHAVYRLLTALHAWRHRGRGDGPPAEDVPGKSEQM